MPEGNRRHQDAEPDGGRLPRQAGQDGPRVGRRPAASAREARVVVGPVEAFVAGELGELGDLKLLFIAETLLGLDHQRDAHLEPQEICGRVVIRPNHRLA